MIVHLQQLILQLAGDQLARIGVAQPQLATRDDHLGNMHLQDNENDENRGPKSGTPLSIIWKKILLFFLIIH